MLHPAPVRAVDVAQVWQVPSQRQVLVCAQIAEDFTQIAMYRDIGWSPKKTYAQVHQFDPHASRSFLTQAINTVYFDRIALQMTPNEIADTAQQQCLVRTPPWKPLK